MRCVRWLFSAATHIASGFSGGALKSDAAIEIDDAEVRSERVQYISYPPPTEFRSAVRVVLGPQDRNFSAETIKPFLSKQFQLTDAYDRTGVRLTGPLLSVNEALDMPAEAIVRGSIQISADGRIRSLSKVYRFYTIFRPDENWILQPMRILQTYRK